MCGRYASTLPPEMMEELFKLLNSIDLVPRYNIAPTQPVAAIWEAHGRREAHFARWGLVPGWVKDPREFPLLINARVETMAEKPAFRDALKHGRCIIPASGYYEWHTNPDKTKQPYYITMARRSADGAGRALCQLDGPERRGDRQRRHHHRAGQCATVGGPRSHAGHPARRGDRRLAQCARRSGARGLPTGAAARRMAR